MFWLKNWRWWLIIKLAGHREVGLNLMVRGTIEVRGPDAILYNCRIMGTWK